MNKANKLGLFGIVLLMVGAIVFTSRNTASVPTPPVFTHVSYAEAIKTNQSDGKALIVKATAEWCPPCKKMNRTTFVDPSVVAWINSNATAIELDVDAENATASEIGIRAMPTIIVYKGGKELARTEGYLGPDGLIAYAEKALASAK